MSQDGKKSINIIEILEEAQKRQDNNENTEIPKRVIIENIPKESYDKAIFRYGVLSDLISNTTLAKSNAEFFREASKKGYKDENGIVHHFHPSTIERWYYRYKHEGFEGLCKRIRKDKGISRRIDEDIKNAISYYYNKYKRANAKSIHDILVESCLINKHEISVSTVRRYLKLIKDDKDLSGIKEMRRYEQENINIVWAGDTSYFPAIKDNGKTKTTYLIAFIDDASRFIVGADIFFEDNYENVLTVLKTAFEKYGIPQKITLDRGTPYLNKSMQILAGKLGIKLVYCKPNNPESKAKIERWFRIIKDYVYVKFDFKNGNMDELKKIISQNIEIYNNKEHSSLMGLTPSQRYFQEASLIKKIDNQKIWEACLLEKERTVSKDGLVSLENRQYEVPFLYASKKIILYYTSDMSDVYIKDENNNLLKLKLLNKHINAQAKRFRFIDEVEKNG